MDEWANLEGQDLIDAMNQFEVDAALALEKRRVEEIFSANGLEFFFNCGAETGNLIFTEFYLSTCESFWKRTISDKGSPFGIIDYQTTSCGTVCCKSRRAYCFESIVVGLEKELIAIIEQDFGSEQIGECPISEPTPPGPGGYVLIGDGCNTSCN